MCLKDCQWSRRCAALKYTLSLFYWIYNSCKQANRFNVYYTYKEHKTAKCIKPEHTNAALQNDIVPAVFIYLHCAISCHSADDWHIWTSLFIIQTKCIVTENSKILGEILVYWFSVLTFVWLLYYLFSKHYLHCWICFCVQFFFHYWNSVSWICSNIWVPWLMFCLFLEGCFWPQLTD
jgi:hypothetical protein